jgi:hypothetical protein
MHAHTIGAQSTLVLAVPKTTPDMLKYITFQNDVCATRPAQVDREMISVPTRH